jgi:hypothetical protein
LIRRESRSGKKAWDARQHNSPSGRDVALYARMMPRAPHRRARETEIPPRRWSAQPYFKGGRVSTV